MMPICFCSNPAMAITGAIMITMSTDMYHHSGPRVVFCAATSTGMVCALALERNNVVTRQHTRMPSRGR